MELEQKAMSLKEIGALIQAARNEEELTQSQLAEELNVNPMTISLAENGSDRTGKGLLNRLAHRFNLVFDLGFPFDAESE